MKTRNPDHCQLDYADFLNHFVAYIVNCELVLPGDIRAVLRHC